MARPFVSRCVWLVAATFVAYFILLVYCDIARPEGYGYRGTIIGGQMVVSSVISTPDTPASRAGLRAGDIIVAADGSRIETIRDWTRVEGNIEYGRPIQLTIQRGSQAFDRALALSSARWSYWLTEPGVVMLTVLGVQGIALVVAIVIVWRRADDPVAVLGAWTLFTVAVYMIVVPYRFAAVWRGLPTGVGALLWIPYVSGQAAAAVLFTFFASFPRRLIRSVRLWAAAWTPMTLVLLRPIGDAWLWIYRPAQASTPSMDGRLGMAATSAYLMAGIIALVVNYRRLTDANERRRLRIVVIGAIGGLVPGLLATAFARLRPDADVAASIFASRLTVVGTMSLLLFPASFAYTILRHRVFDISVMIRQGLRYAVARGVLLSLVPGLALLLIGDVLVRGDQPLAVILNTRASVYTVIATVAVIAHLRRRQWLDTLDRRFFREQYNAHRLLGQVAQDIRSFGDFARVAPRVVAQIDAALHPEFVALLIRAPAELSYASLIATPAGLAPPPLRVDSTLVALLRVLQMPLEVSSGTPMSLAHQLPPQEREMLRAARMALLVPIVTSPQHADAVLTLGMKRSEEPYTHEDRELLAIIATQLTLVLERPAPAVVRPAALAAECPQCGACYDAPMDQCVHDGTSLRATRLPRLFATRYRIDRRLGGGGFGTVYEALDTALDRWVAIKTIREELLIRPDIAKRFQREARLAAGFVHPNVVTVHDFGIDTSGRAFLVMERLEGITLREALVRHTRLSPTRALAIMRDVCAAIDAAHRRLLVHRDLKPENIFLVTDGLHDTAKVLDFGVARALDEARDTLTEIGVLVGSLRYMAPAQLRGDDVQPSADLWALGIIAYEMLTGSHPFASVPLGDLSASPPDASTAIGSAFTDVPASWRTFFRRVLTLESRRRPSTPAEFLSELERALASVAA